MADTSVQSGFLPTGDLLLGERGRGDFYVSIDQLGERGVVSVFVYRQGHARYSDNMLLI